MVESMLQPNNVQLSCTGNIKLRKKRKRSNVDDVLNDMVDKLIKREESADKRFMEFQERRLKFKGRWRNEGKSGSKSMIDKCK